jgi:ABC-type sugar transport system ATPase subunit
MVGREVDRVPRPRAVQGAIVAEIAKVSGPDALQDLSLSVHAGEILAVAGLDGSGREGVARLLAGIQKPSRGRITLNGAPHPGTLRAAMRHGVGYVPDDRKTLGLFLDLSVAANAVATDLAQVSRAGLVQETRVLDAGTEMIRDQGVKAQSPGIAVRSLSGGNQQKVLIGKWLRREPRLLIVEEPTKGVDINAKRDIHARLASLAQGGAAVVIVSSDLPEILELSDRIAVLHRGRLMDVILTRSSTEESVLALASGLSPEPASAVARPAG